MDRAFAKSLQDRAHQHQWCMNAHFLILGITVVTFFANMIVKDFQHTWVLIIVRESDRPIGGALTLRVGAQVKEQVRVPLPHSHFQNLVATVFQCNLNALLHHAHQGTEDGA